jgi:hypothetical protein
MADSLHSPRKLYRGPGIAAGNFLDENLIQIYLLNYLFLFATNDVEMPRIVRGFLISAFHSQIQFIACTATAF